MKCVISTAILDSTSPTSTDGKRIRREIWEFSLIDVLILVLKHDYSIIEGQWMTAAKLTTILRYITRPPDKSALSITSLKQPHSKKGQKWVFKTNYRLMQVKSIAECSKGSILQYMWPALSYHMALRPFLYIFEWPLKTGFTVFKNYFSYFSTKIYVMGTQKNCLIII